MNELKLRGINPDSVGYQKKEKLFKKSTSKGVMQGIFGEAIWRTKWNV